MIPAAPCSTASNASSAVCTPLTSTGSFVSLESRSTSFQLIDGEISLKCSETDVARIAPSAASSAGTAGSSGISQPVRRSRSRRPKYGASIVSTIARKPAATAWSTIERVTPFVAEDVELEPARRVGCGGGDLGRRRGRHRRHRHDRPERGGRARRRDLALGVRVPLVGHRRDDDRRRELVPEHRPLRGHVLDVAEEPWPKRPAAVRVHVLAQRPLVAGARREVPERPRGAGAPRHGVRSRTRSAGRSQGAT